MSKKLFWLGISLLIVLLLSSCMSLFTALTIEGPEHHDSSMLILESGSNGEYLMNNNYTGWAPLVKGEDGTIIHFKMVNALADAQTMYVAPNVKEGNYTIIGFRHVYTDYGLLQDGDSPMYEPYVESPYHVNQEFFLEEPITVNLSKREIQSFGYFSIEYEHNGGGFADRDDRWAVIPSSVSISSNPSHTNILRVIKGFRTPEWEMWNERNQYEPY